MPFVDRNSKGSARRPLVSAGLVAACALLALAGVAGAHDFWLVPDAFRLAAGDRLEVRGQTSSRFPTSESAVALDRVREARLISAGGEEPITEMSHRGTSLLLRHRPAAPGQYVVAVALRPRAVRESSASFRRYLELEGAPEALARVEGEGLLRGRDSLTRRYAKYAKTLVEVASGGARAFSRAAGHPLEFIPERDPAAHRAGDTLAVRVLYRGRPLPGARVHAGVVPAPGGRAQVASDPADPARQATEATLHLMADSAGRLRIPLGRGGLWNVRMIHVVPANPGSGADWDTHWATLVFLIGEAADRAGETRADDSSAVAAVVERYQQALASGDSATALALLAPDAVILEAGGVETREQYRSHHLAGDIAFARAVRREPGPIRVTVRGDVAWASSTSTSRGSNRGRPVDSAGAELMVLSREADGWRIRAIHWSSRSRRPPA